MWKRAIAYPLIAVIILLLEVWALVDGIPGTTITDWITDFPRWLWWLTIAFLIWLPIHLVQTRRDRRG